MLEAGFGELSMRVQEVALVAFIRRFGQLAAGLPATEWRVGLDGESVERQVRRFELERVVDVPRPISIDALWQGEDQVQRDVGDAAVASDLHGARNCFG